MDTKGQTGGYKALQVLARGCAGTAGHNGGGHFSSATYWEASAERRACADPRKQMDAAGQAA